MRTLALIIFVFSLFSLAAKQIPEPPQYYRFVQDYPNRLSEEQEKYFLSILRENYRNTGNEVVMVVESSMTVEELLEYGEQVIKFWRIGGDRQNGVLICCTIEENNRYQLEYFASDSLKPYFSKEVIQRVKSELVYPVWENESLSKGLNEAILAGIRLANKENIFDEGEGVPPIPIWVPILALAVIFYILLRNSNGSMTIQSASLSRNKLQEGGGFNRGGSGGGFSGDSFAGDGAQAQW